MIALLLLAASPQDQLFVSSFDPAAVQIFEPASGAPIDTLQAGSRLVGALGSTLGPDGLLYVASEGTHEVLRFEPSSGQLVDVFVRDDPATAADESGGLRAPSGVVFGPDGRLYVGSFTGDSILRFDGQTGAFVDVFVAPGAGNLNGPDSGMAFGPSGDLYVPSYFNRRVKRYDGVSGAFLENAFTPVSSGLRNPRAVLFIGAGLALVTSESTDEVLRFNAVTGDFVDALIFDDPVTVADETGGLDGPTGIVLSNDGSLLVASVGTNEVKHYSATGTFLADAIPAGANGVSSPVHLTLGPRITPGCSPLAHREGPGAQLAVRGSTSITADQLRFELSYAPAATTTILIQGAGAAPVTVGNGLLCLSSPLFRVGIGTTDTVGASSWSLSLAAPTAPGAAIFAGSTWSFQAAFRDTLPAGAGALHFSSSLEVRFDS